MWIDLRDKIVTHVEAWPVEDPREITTQNLPSGPASIMFDDMRLADGMWVRRSRYVDTRKDPVAFNGLNLEWKQDFSGYQRYFTESKDYKIEEPKEPPPSPPAKSPQSQR